MPNTRTCIVLAICAATISTTLLAQRPSAPTTIPVLPGAERYDAEQRQVVNTIRETLLGLSDGVPLLSSTREQWFAQVTPDKVDAFYRAQLGGIASSFAQWKSVDPRTLAPGRATSVHAQRYTDAGTTRYVYHWYRMDTNGDIVLHELSFGATIAADPRLPKTGPLTLLTVTRKTYSQTAPALAPDENTLGVPVYPGATYDANASTSTLGALFSHVFRTTDATTSVVAFYERACNSRALQGAPLGGGVNWVFRPCAPAHPDDYIVIEPAEDAGLTRTRIIFHLMRDGSPDHE
jgi:hypothetical protein